MPRLPGHLVAEPQPPGGHAAHGAFTAGRHGRGVDVDRERGVEDDLGRRGDRGDDFKVARLHPSPPRTLSDGVDPALIPVEAGPSSLPVPPGIRDLVETASREGPMPTTAVRASSAPRREHAVAISATGVVKTFGRSRALDGLDLTVATGEVHGFLGPNGAGKTTTIRVLLGLLRADAGEVTLLGGDPWRDVAALHRRLAYVPGDVTLWPNLSGGEVIDLLGRLRGGQDARRKAELLER